MEVSSELADSDTGSLSFTVHPSDLYVGVKLPAQKWEDPSKALAFNVVVADDKGAIQEGLEVDVSVEPSWWNHDSSYIHNMSILSEGQIIESSIDLALLFDGKCVIPYSESLFNGLNLGGVERGQDTRVG